MSHWMCDDKSPVLPLRDLRPMSDSRPPEPKGDHSLVSQKGGNFFLRIDPNRNLHCFASNNLCNIPMIRICETYIECS